MINLGFIPYASEYDWDDDEEGYVCWSIGDPEKSEDTWHVTVIKNAYAVIDIVLPMKQLEAGGYHPFSGGLPPMNLDVPIWLVYQDFIDCSKTPSPDLPDWVSQVLQPQLKPWDGVKRDHIQESINNDTPPISPEWLLSQLN